MNRMQSIQIQIKMSTVKMNFRLSNFLGLVRYAQGKVAVATVEEYTTYTVTVPRESLEQQGLHVGDDWFAVVTLTVIN